MIESLQIHFNNQILVTGDYMYILKIWHANTYNEEGFKEIHPNDNPEDYKLNIDLTDPKAPTIKLVAVGVLDQIGF